MAFELNENGSINSLPLYNWELATIADVGCMVRLVLATSAERPAENQKSVQFSMSDGQLELLVQDLQKIAAKIRDTYANRSTH
jgi:hypothetical protein